MIRLATLAAPVVAAAAAAMVPAASWAANAQHPYSNVDRRVDAGNDTGDAQVDALNQQQLNRTAPPAPGTPIYTYAPPPAYVAGPVYAPPVVYARPPVVYAPPPVVVAPYPYDPYRYDRPYYPY